MVREAHRRRIETVCIGGYGGEATVYVQLRNLNPGPGGEVTTSQDFVVACRVPNELIGKVRLDDTSPQGPPDYSSATVRKAMTNVYAHTILKVLDTYFFRSGRYRYAHIPRILGMTANGCTLYEWVHGNDAFPAEYTGGAEIDFRRVPVMVEEEALAANSFASAGIELLHDTLSVNEPYRKNIVIEEPFYDFYEGISRLWKRIDISIPNSLHMKHARLRCFLRDNRAAMERMLTPERVRLVELANEFMATCTTPASFPDYPELERLMLDFRRATAQAMECESGSPRQRERKLLVIGIAEALRIRRKRQPKKVRMSNQSVLSCEIRSSLPCIEGAIHTHQDQLVARIQRREDPAHDIALRLFLRHFIVKKLENYFIECGHYSFAHIPRPLGYHLGSRSYWYEWAHGNARAPRSFIEGDAPARPETGLSEWSDFRAAFLGAGVDMAGRLRFVGNARARRGAKFAKQIIVRQPVGTSEPQYISRMWKRVNFHPRSVPIDFGRLTAFLATHREAMEQTLFKEDHAIGRYRTILHAVRYLTRQPGQHLDPRTSAELYTGLLNYCLSALCHLDNRGFEESPDQLRSILLEKATLRYPGAA